MTAYVEQIRRSEKRVDLIEGSLQVVRLLLSNDQARRGLTRFVDLVFDVRGRHQHLRYALSGSNTIATWCAIGSTSTYCHVGRTPEDHRVTESVNPAYNARPAVPGATRKLHLGLVRVPLSQSLLDTSLRGSGYEDHHIEAITTSASSSN